MNILGLFGAGKDEKGASGMIKTLISLIGGQEKLTATIKEFLEAENKKHEGAVIKFTVECRGGRIIGEQFKEAAPGKWVSLGKKDLTEKPLEAFGIKI